MGPGDPRGTGRVSESVCRRVKAPRSGEMSIHIPEDVVRNGRRTRKGSVWLSDLPGTVDAVLEQWSLRLEQAKNHPAGTASVVLLVRRSDNSPAVLKLGMPHMEAEHEVRGLRHWDGDPTVRVLEADEARNAVLLERCVPGTPLTQLPEMEQDVVIAGLLSRLWRVPPEPGVFRPLDAMLRAWGREAQRASKVSDQALMDEGLRLFEELPRTAGEAVVLATDLHAGNVLKSGRRPWLVIDPKPFVGDPAYDLVQHLLNCGDRMKSDPKGTVRRLSDLTGQDEERVGLWVFARLATGTWPSDGHEWSEVVRVLSR